MGYPAIAKGVSRSQSEGIARFARPATLAGTAPAGTIAPPLLPHLTLFATLYFLLANSSYLLVLGAGLISARRYYGEATLGMPSRMASLRSLTPISVLVPAYNEEKSLVSSVEALLRLNYPDFEVVVCNDGSKDATMAILREHFQLILTKALPPQQLPSEPIRAERRRFACQPPR